MRARSSAWSRPTAASCTRTATRDPDARERAAGVGTYSWDPERERYPPTVLQVVTLREGRVAEIMGFVAPELFPRFGLPDSLAA
jgi:hypothetical protein